jgi:hypothetical protein
VAISGPKKSRFQGPPLPMVLEVDLPSWRGGGGSGTKCIYFVLGCPSKLVPIRNNQTSFGTIRNKTFVSVVSVLYQKREFWCFDWTESNRRATKTVWQRAYLSIFFNKFCGILVCFVLFWFVLVFLVCFGLFWFVLKLFVSISKQRVSIFQLNQNKPKTNRRPTETVW